MTCRLTRFSSEIRLRNPILPSKWLPECKEDNYFGQRSHDDRPAQVMIRIGIEFVPFSANPFLGKRKLEIPALKETLGNLFHKKSVPRWQQVVRAHCPKWSAGDGHSLVEPKTVIVVRPCQGGRNLFLAIIVHRHFEVTARKGWRRARGGFAETDTKLGYRFSHPLQDLFLGDPNYDINSDRRVSYLPKTFSLSWPSWGWLVVAENSRRWKRFNHRKKPPGRKIKRELVATEKDPGSLNPTTATPVIFITSSRCVLVSVLCAHKKEARRPFSWQPSQKLCTPRRWIRDPL